MIRAGSISSQEKFCKIPNLLHNNSEAFQLQEESFKKLGKDDYTTHRETCDW